MTDDDIKRARRMTFRLYSLGERQGFSSAGELAQLIAGNSFFQNDKCSNIIKLCLESSDEKLTSAPLNKALQLFMSARREISEPFGSRSDCLQSCIFDMTLCYVSFWGQIFEYYETMYYKPVQLPDGEPDTSPASIPFENGWLLTCLFIRDMMLSAAARSAGVSSGYDRSMSWYYFPANATSELEEAKALVLAVIARIRKRGTVLVSNEGMLGHISFSNTVPLTHWIEDKLNKDITNMAKMETLAEEYFESSSIRVNVNVIPVSNISSGDPSTPGEDNGLNTSFSALSEASFLDAFDTSLTEESTGDNSPSIHSTLSMSSRSISLNIRPITPTLLGSSKCDWSGIEMLDFCKEIVNICKWPEVVYTVSTAGQIGISVLNMSGEVTNKSKHKSSRRSSLSAPSRLSLSPETRHILPAAILPPAAIPTPTGMPRLEPLGMSPGFGFLPIPQLTPTPTKNSSSSIPIPTPTPPIFQHRPNRVSDVTFFGGDDSPNDDIMSNDDHRMALAPIPDESLPSATHSSASPSKPLRDDAIPLPVSSRPSFVEQDHAATPPSLDSVVRSMSRAARSDVSAKNWSLTDALGDLYGPRLSLPNLYAHILAVNKEQPSQTNDNQNVENPGNKRRRSSERLKKSSSAADTNSLPLIVQESVLKHLDARIMFLVDSVNSRCLKGLSSEVRKQFLQLTRILVLAYILSSPKGISDIQVQCCVAIAGDFACFCTASPAVIATTDVYAAGLRSMYVDSNISMFEIGKDLGFQDWYTLSLFYNDFAFAVLMGPQGLFQPSVPSTAPSGSRSRSAAPSKLVKLSLWEQLPQHCLLVCTELMMRWAWSTCSRLWDIYLGLVRSYDQRRHGIKETGHSFAVSESELAELNYFVKQCMVNAGMHLVDIADRLGASQLVIHGAFDIVRSVFLLRPKMIQSRHVYQIVYASLVASAQIFGQPIEFSRVVQAAILTQLDDFAKSIASTYITNFVSLSSCDASVMFSDGSGALVLPNESGQQQPEFQLTGDVQKFYESVFVFEMRQVLFNMKKITQRRSVENPKGDFGPFVQEMDGLKHPSVSPFSFVAISSSMALAMQQFAGLRDVQFKSVPYSRFKQAMNLISPFGLLPCLLPPSTPHEEHQHPNECYYKWFNDSVIRATKQGHYSVISI